MPKKRSPAKKQSRTVTYDTVCDLVRALPEIEYGSSYGTQAIKVRGKLMARLKEDGETLVLRSDFIERDFLVSHEPDVFFFTDHYRDYPYVLVRLPRIKRAALAQLLEDAWRRSAPKRVAQTLDAERGAEKHR